MLLCRVARTTCAVPADEVQEILPIMRLSRPPGLPPLLAGFFQLEGLVVPVVKLARLLEVAEESTRLFTPIVVLRHVELLAIKVDAMLQMIDVCEEDIAPVAGPVADQKIAEGLIKRDGRLIPIISPARLLFATEAACIEALRAREQARVDELQGVPA